MKDNHEYTDEDGVKWKRVFAVPNASIDTRIDDFSSNEFVDKTKDKGMTMGQLWEESKQASKKPKEASKQTSQPTSGPTTQLTNQ